MIERSRDWTAARPRPKPRKKDVIAPLHALRRDRLVGRQGQAGTRASRSRCARPATRRPRLVDPPGRPGRAPRCSTGCGRARTTPPLFGFDFSFAPPIVERGAYLPGEDTPATARAFWAYVDAAERDDADLGAAALPRKPAPPPFLFRRGRRRRRRDFLHLRLCEAQFNATGGGKASTALRRDRRRPGRQGELRRHAAAPPARRRHSGLADRSAARDRGALVVEIYTAIAARAAGLRKGRARCATPRRSTPRWRQSARSRTRPLAPL